MAETVVAGSLFIGLTEEQTTNVQLDDFRTESLL